jgi:eukaryotic-like serine/threonine-protein kinase
MLPTIPRFGIGDNLGTAGGSIPAYRIVSHLGTGGAGRIYQARILASNEMVVLKTPKTWRHVFDLFQEARYTVREAFPHVARLRDVDCTYMPDLQCDLPFIVMDGYSVSLFRRLTEQGPIDLCDGLRWLAECARGLQASQLVHRDLKPENILLDDQQRAWVCDFGLALPASPLVRKKMGLRINGVVGTMAYMSPEQIYEAADIDVRADIYALGLILYEMSTGRPGHPLYNERKMSEQEYLRLVCDVEVPWRDVRVDAVAEIVKVCTAKKRCERYADYWALLDAIEEAMATLR